MPHLFAAILLLANPSCPHDEPSCITPSDPIQVEDSYGSFRFYDTEDEYYHIELTPAEAWLCSLSPCSVT